MLGLPLAFTIPAVLVALAALPVLYWLLRLTPPPPAQVVLPTLSIMRDIERKEETPAHTPWWLLLLRLLLAALFILAMAGPLWNPDLDARSGRGPLLVVMDNSWSSAPDWTLRQERALALIETAGAAGRPVAIRAISDEAVDIVAVAAPRAIEQLRSLVPVPQSLDRRRHRASISAFLSSNPEASVLWLTDRVSVLGDSEVIADLSKDANGRLTILAPDSASSLGLAGATNAPDALSVRVLRAQAGDAVAGALRATDARGRPIAETRFLMPQNAREVAARFEVPLEIRNDFARIDMVEQASAGAVLLLDGRNKRRRIGIITGETTDTAQPLLSPAYFLARALGPFADVRETPRGTADPYARAIEDGAAVLVLADIGTLAGATLTRLTEFVDKGGVLIRFASRRVAAPSDGLLPVRLRRNERIMGGVLSWDTPRKLASFAASGPFEGMTLPGDVTVSQQVLAEPDSALPEKTWAALEDGTPLVTGERRGKGHVVLYHVTADTGWSSLPLSVAFVESLRRLTGLAEVTSESIEAAATTGVSRTELILPPLRNLDGFGAFHAPPVAAEPVKPNHTEPASAKHPPGFYGVAESPLAVNTLAANTELYPVNLTGLIVRPLVAGQAMDLRGLLMSFALLAFLLDALAALWLSGALSRLRAGKASVAAILALLAGAFLLAPAPVVAQQTSPLQNLPLQNLPQQNDRLPAFRADDIEAALSTRLAYVITGDSGVDETSRQGLQGLSRNLTTRTALDPGEPIGLDISRDELTYYPLLYWPMVAGRTPPSEAAIRRIETYMKGGGTIVFDTRDALNNRGGNSTTPETQLMRRILASIDVPDLETIPKDHVITKTFYILEGFVGRYNTGKTWIEVLQRNQEQDKTRPAQAGDRVSPIIITGNDLAAAWAVDRAGQPRFPLVPGDARQREMAIRGGINIVIYALTGNYKADQVHVPALLERLGQ
jgi:Domain of unknown function (DUF4159)/Aerotolerance regulator N-terminal